MEECAKMEKESSKIEIVEHRINASCKEIDDINRRLCEINDKLMGALPENPSACDAPMSEGLISKVNYSLDYIESSIQSLNSQLIRLTSANII